MSDRCPGCSGWGAHTDLCTIDTLKAKIAAQAQEIKTLREDPTTGKNCRDCDFGGKGHDRRWLAVLCSECQNKPWKELAAERAKVAELRALLDSKGPPWCFWSDILKQYSDRVEAAEARELEARKEHEDCDSKRSQANIEWNELTKRTGAAESKVTELRKDLSLQKEAGRQQWELTVESEAKVAALEKDLGRAREALQEIELHLDPDKGAPLVATARGLALKFLAAPEAPIRAERKKT